MPERAVFLIARRGVALLGLIHVGVVVNLVLRMRGPATILIRTCAGVCKRVVLVHVPAGHRGVGVPAGTPAFFGRRVVLHALFLTAVAVLALLRPKSLHDKAQGVLGVSDFRSAVTL